MADTSSELTRIARPLLRNSNMERRNLLSESNIQSLMQQQPRINLIRRKSTTTRRAGRMISEINNDTNQTDTVSNNTSNNGDVLELQLWFSIWFPKFNGDANEHEFNEMLKNANDPIRQGVLKSFTLLLCQETDILVMNNDTTGSSEPAVVDYCLQAKKASNQDQSSRRQLDSTTSTTRNKTDTKVWFNPKVNIRRRSETSTNETLLASLVTPTDSTNNESAAAAEVPKNLTLSWTVWTVTYEVMNVGYIYTEETLMNQPTIKYTDLAKESVQTMEEVIQIAVDVNIRNGVLDTILAEEVPNDNSHIASAAYSSPLRYEFNTFISEYQNTLYIMPPFEPRVWYPERMVGLLILLVSFLAYGLLYFLSKRRRLRLNKEHDEEKLLNDDDEEGDEDADEGDHPPTPRNLEERWSLHNIQGVEAMLNRSSRLSLPNIPNMPYIRSDSEMSTSHVSPSLSSVRNPTRVRDSPFAPDPRVTIPSSVGKVALSILQQEQEQHQQIQENGGTIPQQLNGRTPSNNKLYLSVSSSSSSSSSDEIEAVIDLLNHDHTPNQVVTNKKKKSIKVYHVS